MRTFLLSVMALVATVLALRATADDFEAWLDNEGQVAVERLNLNISAPQTHRGSILASPSQHDPNYYFYWVRDGAMVMRAIFDRVAAGDANAVSQFKDYVAFTRENQEVAATSPYGLGDPRFNVDGNLDTLPWGRPQNDGPALRAITMIRYARSLLAHGDRASVERDLYLAEMPARTVIKTDLEFVAHHWQDRCIDLWEENMGHHFFTEAAQMVAMKEGSALALEMNDPAAAKFYGDQASALELELAKHWDASKGYYLSAIDFSSTPDHAKPTQLDVSVLLAALFVEQPSGLLSLTDDHIIKTAEALESMFGALYPINAAHSDLGTAIGRYKEDVYYGGNPWILTTAAFAEWNYRMAGAIASSKHFVLTGVQADYITRALAQASMTSVVSANMNLAADEHLRAQAVAALKLRGDAFMKRIRQAAGVTGYLAEQFDLKTGEMLSARDLSWSYAAFMRASEARAELH